MVHYLTNLRLYSLLFSAHPSVTNPLERRVLELLAIFTVLTTPIAPMIWFFQVKLSVIEEVSRSPIWIIIPLGSLVIYLLVRSPWYSLSIHLQILLSFLFPVYLSIIDPASQGNFQAMIIPVCLAALLLNFRTLFCISVVVALVFFFLLLNIPVVYQKDVALSFIVFLMVTMLMLLIRFHQSWLEQYRIKDLSEQHEKFLQLIQATFDGTATMRNQVFVQVSPEFSSVFERTPKEMEGREIEDFLQNLEWPLSSIVETSFQVDDAKIRFVQLANQASQGKDSIVAIKDITKERMEQVTRLQMDRMTSTGMLASGIAHELNTPLMIAMTQSQMAFESCVEGRTEDVLERLKTSQDVLEQMADIVKDLKWFVQPSWGIHTFSCRDVIENTIRLANHRIRHLSEIEFECVDDSPISMAENQLNQVIINLLFNAVEAKKSNKVMVNIHIKTSISQDFLMISIKDDGIGISESMQAKIFEPFFTTNKSNGTGLGLAICQNLLLQSEGFISVESEVGIGSKFIIHVPTLSPKNIIQTDTTPVIHRDSKILIIDDDENLLPLISEMLHECTCITAKSIEIGKQLMKEYSIDVIICDMIMSTGGGWELYKDLQENGSNDHQKMIFITGGTIDIGMQEFLRESIQPVIYKPFRLKEIQQAISKVCV